MLTYRPRGKNGIFYIRGQVSLGDKRIDVKEFSSGTSDKDAASHLMAEYETKLRHQLMFGPAAVIASGVMADAFASYLSKAKSPHPSDILRISILNQHIGDLSLNEPKQAWDVFRAAYLSEHEPAGQDRYRAVLQAAINVHRDLHSLEMVKIKAVPFENERVRWLEKEERDRLIASYTPHVQPIATMLAFHGPRCQTALQIQWGTKGVDMKREAIRFYHTKNGVVSNVPMHARVKEVLLPIWEDRGRPKSGHVFLNRFGEPYQDTRLAPIPGGKRVLFVAEKMAALEVVHRRLQAVGLGPLTLELHSSKANKRTVLDELKRTKELALAPRCTDPGVVDALGATRDTLNAHAEVLHVVQEPYGLSAFQILGQLMRTGGRAADFELDAAADWTRRRSHWPRPPPFRRRIAPPSQRQSGARCPTGCCRCRTPGVATWPPRRGGRGLPISE